MLTSLTTNTDVGEWNLVTNCTPIGELMRRIDQPAIEFGLDHPPFHRARVRLGIPWHVFRRDWNRLAAGIRDRKLTKAARRVIRHAGFCLFTEECDHKGVTLTCI